MPKKTKETTEPRPGLDSAPHKYRPKSHDTFLHAVQWTGTVQSAQDIIDFCHDTNGYRRLVVFRPVNTGGDVALYLWVARVDTYVLVPVGHHVCKEDPGDGSYFLLSDRQLRNFYVIA